MTWNHGPRSTTRRMPAVPRQAIVMASFLATVLLAGSPTASTAAGNAIAGKEIYQTRCVGCHGGGGIENTLGPSLVGIIGRKAGTGESGVHSRPMTESGIRWDETSLRIFLAAPMRTLEGTNMPASVADPREIDDLIAYLKTLR